MATPTPALSPTPKKKYRNNPQTKLPSCLPIYGWQLTKPDPKHPGRRGSGYLRYVSRAINTPIPRGTRAHRWVIERLIHAELTLLYGDYSPIACHRRSILEELLLNGRLHPDVHVHHQDFDKTHCCGPNLVVMHPSMNPRGPVQHPYTGQRITQAEYTKIVGK